MDTKLKTTKIAASVCDYMIKKAVLTGLALVVAVVLAPVLTFAAQAGGGAEQHGSIADLKWPAINFSLYVVGMYFLLRGTVSTKWAARSNRIAAEAGKGERELAVANALLAAAKERQTKLPTEKASIARAMAIEAQAEAQKALQDATQRSLEIEIAAANRIIAEQQAAAQSTRRRIAEQVIASTEAKIKAGISADADKRIRQSTARSINDLAINDLANSSGAN